MLAARRAEAQHREQRFRAGRPPLQLAGRTVIVVDDGLATGATMRAALRMIRKQQPKHLVAAVPVGAPETCASIAHEVDELHLSAATRTAVLRGRALPHLRPDERQRGRTPAARLLVTSDAGPRALARTHLVNEVQIAMADTFKPTAACARARPDRYSLAARWTQPAPSTLE